MSRKRKRFVAWDGEGVTLNGVHRYVLLANSDGAVLRNPLGITTREALRFFLTQCDPNAIHAIFVGTYDANMILGALDRPRVAELWFTGQSFYIEAQQFFSLRYTPRRELFIKDASPSRWESPTRGMHARVWDVYGFFQSSFVKAARDWLGDRPIIAQIAAMKERRGTFSLDDLADDSLESYCKHELTLLAELCELVRATCESIGYVPRRWDGAGAIATSMLRAHGVKRHVGPRPTKDVLEPLATAFSGGRIETTGVGFVGDCWVYDIRSAYPDAMRALRSNEHARWIFDAKEPRSTTAIADVAWDLPVGYSWYPLFYRQGDGAIMYPPAGRGWYWLPEVALLKRFVAQRAKAGRYTIHGYWSLIDCECASCKASRYPFAWTADVYERRRDYEAQSGRSREAHLLKLGLNSLFGKTCQTVGWVRKGEKPKEPPFFNLAWAGEVTAMVRARLGHLALDLDAWDVVQFATDALFTRRRPKIVPTQTMGGYSERYIENLLLVQSGVYWYHDPDKDEDVHRSRGYDLKDMRDPAFVYKAFAQNVRSVDVGSTRFVSMGQCVHTPELLREYWRTWQTFKRPLRLDGGSSKRSPVDPKINLVDASADFVRTGPAPSLEFHHLGLPSAPYNIPHWPLTRRAAKTEEREEEELRDCDDEANA